MEMQVTSPRFSIVVPIYNEEQNIRELHRRLSVVLEKLCDIDNKASIGKCLDDKMGNNKWIGNCAEKSPVLESRDSEFEIIMVNDGSADRSWEIIGDLNTNDKRVQGISFSRNFGHHIAISAGIDYAKGDYVILMDGDLQDPPEEIPKLYSKLHEGYDLVYGIRSERKDSYFRRIATHLFTRAINKISGFHIAENDAMLRIMNRQYVDNFKRFSETNRFLAGLFSWTGFNQTGVEIEHAPRFSGNSKYDLSKMIKLTLNAITSFSYFPLRLATYAGIVVSGLSFIMGIGLIARKLIWDIALTGWASIMATILFIGGIQLLMLGVIGEYLGRVFSEVQKRPLYIVKESTYD